MFFKKLQLVGFKTFAEKTEIDIGEGLTAVVGPNGSGKSNIADAILWVLGEQNPRLIRGSESRDVIFAGTAKRKPLGMASVTLTIDNSTHALPIDFAEVTVTRRIYRSGESNYLLNGAPCRLKDIIELFLDTGLGKGAYSFVSQSEIDAVLSARPEDRRELFEEAAGIKKYRVKKREAVRKLENAEGNLDRVRDIIFELDQQREPMREQAETARRYLELTARLQQIEVDLLVSEVQRADYELYAARQERDLDQQAILKFDAELAILERQADALGEKLALAEQEAESARHLHQSAVTNAERTENQLQLVSERGHTAEQSADQLDEELRGLGVRITQLTKELESQSKALEKAESDERARKESLSAARARLAELEKAVAESTRRSEDRQAVLLQLAQQSAQRESALQAARQRSTETQERLSALSTEAETLTAQLKEATGRQAATESEANSYRSDLSDLSNQKAGLQNQANQARDREARLRTSLDSARRLLAERSSRLATLTELQESGEGFYQGVRAVLKAQKDGGLKGFYAPAVDLLTVPERLRVAVEVALGGSLQDIVCETEEQAKAGIEWLKTSRAGRATFLALPLLRPAPPGTAASLQGIKGIEGTGADLVKIEPRFRAVLDLLLGRVVLAEDMDSAIAASRKLQGWSRIVTLQGELLAPGGALTGGSLQGKGSHLVGRKGEIDDLQAEIPKLLGDVNKVASETEGIGDEIADFDRQLRGIAAAESEASSALAALESESAAARRDVGRLTALHADRDAQAARLIEALDSLHKEITRWESEIAARAEENEDSAIAAAREEARVLTIQRDEARKQSVALEVESGRLAEKRSALARSVDVLKVSLAESESQRAAKQTLRELAGTRFAESVDLRRDLQRKLREAQDHLDQCAGNLATVNQRLTEIRSDSFEKNGAIKEITHTRARTIQELHVAELMIARLEVRLAQAVQRLLDEYGITQEEALARKDVEDPERATVNEVARVRREIRAMGQVNTGAVEEYERLSERHDFLAVQREDLEKARESLLVTIKEIDDSTRGIFMETFEAVSVEFDRLFNRLFGGGSTRLMLTDPEDLLETGIEVIAQPPGKKAQHLSLLSGGERALTAVALLFSFLAVRPSPFCLLDEVDAPLDGPNVEKFIQLVMDFARHTQFLVITHNPTTMEASPRWYGVTMQEPGISRILSYRVPDQAIISEPEMPLEMAAHKRE